MYMLYVCLLAPLIHTGFAFIREETDLNSLSSYDSVDDLNEDYDIWNTQNDDNDILIYESISKQLLKNICENSNTLVYIAQEDLTVDCKTYSQSDQVEDAHAVVKREAIGDFEGSGDDNENVEDGKEIEKNVNESGAESDKNVADEDIKEEAEVVSGEQSGKTHEKMIEETPIKTQEENVNTETEAPPETEIAQDDKTDEEMIQETTIKTQEEYVTTEKIDQETEIAQDEETVQETTTQEKITTEKTDTEAAEETEIAPDDNKDEAMVEKTTIKTHEENLTTEKTYTEAVQEIETTQSKVTFDENITTQKSESETSEKQPEQDSIDTQLPEEKSISVEDKTHENMEKSDIGSEPKNIVPDETNKSNDSDKHNDSGEKKKEGKKLIDPVKTGETTENPKKAGTKDTTILIVLFAAVVLVGALAFAYNFIKKRKQRQRSSDLEKTERAPSIKRSLQNLTKVDGEPEKKPLMGDSKEVEMVDMKKHSTPVKENGESVPQDTL